MSPDSSSTSLSALASRHKDVLRFLAVGASNTLLSYGLFLLFMRALGDSPELAGTAQFLAYSSGVVWSFYWNRRWTFGSTGELGREAVRFFVLQGFMAVLSSALLGFCSARLSLSVHLVWVLVTAITTLLNYLGSKLIVFRASKSGR